MRFCKEYGIVISETLAKMSPGLCKAQDDQACCAVGGRGDTGQGYLQEVLARGRGRGARARAAPSPAAQPPGYSADSYAKARADFFFFFFPPYLLLISNYLVRSGKGKN